MYLIFEVFHHHLDLIYLNSHLVRALKTVPLTLI